MRNIPSWLLISAALAWPMFAAETHVIELKNGTKIVGTIQKEEGGKAYIDAELIGQVVVDVSALAPAPSTAPVAVEATPPPSVKEVPVVVAPASPGAPSAVPQPSAAKVVWKRSLSISGTYNSAAYQQGPIPGAPAALGLTGKGLGLSGKQQTINVSGAIARATPTSAVSLTGSYGYADYQPSGKVVDNWTSEFTFMHVLTPRTYWLGRSTYKVDKIALLDHSFEQVVGFGYKFIDSEQTKLDVIPGLSEVNDRRGTRFDDKWIFSTGFLENFEHAFNDKVSLQQRFKYRVGVKDTEVWAINAYLGIVSQLAEHIALNVGFTYTYDNTLGPLSPTIANGLVAGGIPQSVINQLAPANKDQLQLTTGIDYNW